MTLYNDGSIMKTVKGKQTNDIQTKLHYFLGGTKMIKFEELTEKKMLWYAVRGARDYFISLGEDTRKAEGEVKKIYSSMLHQTGRELRELERMKKKLENKE